MKFKQKINLNNFLEQCVDGYQYAYPSQLFELNVPNENIGFR